MNHSIKVVAKRTGLSPHVIRVWEKRYGAVTPARSATNRRLYSNEEIERLDLLRRVTAAGHSIGNVAVLSEGDLLKLLEREKQSPALPVQSPLRSIHEPASAEEFVGRCMSAIRQLNAKNLEELLDEAVVELGQPGLLQRLLVPLIEQVGQLWRVGELKVAHEHIATAVIRTFLGSLTRSHVAPANAPELIVTTPTGQNHELGAILVAATASNHGWRVTYLGPGLPADEIAGAAKLSQARAVALSLVYPEDDPNLRAQLIQLRRLLAPSTALLVGGRAASAYGAVLKEIGAVLLSDLPDLRRVLDLLRQPAS